MSSITTLYPLGLPVYVEPRRHSSLLKIAYVFCRHACAQTEICQGVLLQIFETQKRRRKKGFMAGFTPLKPGILLRSVMFTLNAPWSVNISLIELTPTEQIPGGVIIERSRETGA